MYEKNESQKNEESQFDADHISSTRSIELLTLKLNLSVYRAPRKVLKDLTMRTKPRC